jgi:hypothetical protein
MYTHVSKCKNNKRRKKKIESRPKEKRETSIKQGDCWQQGVGLSGAPLVGRRVKEKSEGG